MNNVTIRVAQTTDVAAVTDLANQYTYANLSEEERAGGYLGGSFTHAAVHTRITSLPGQVAYHQHELVGFVLNANLNQSEYPLFVQEILASLPGLYYRARELTTYRWFFYGPAVVRPEYRGQGILRQLWQTTKRDLTGHFDLGVTFIAAQNTASLRAHQQLGLEAVGQVNCQESDYTIMVFSIVSRSNEGSLS